MCERTCFVLCSECITKEQNQNREESCLGVPISNFVLLNWARSDRISSASRFKLIEPIHSSIWASEAAMMQLTCWQIGKHPDWLVKCWFFFSSPESSQSGCSSSPWPASCIMIIWLTAPIRVSSCLVPWGPANSAPYWGQVDQQKRDTSLTSQPQLMVIIKLLIRYSYGDSS